MTESKTSWKTVKPLLADESTHFSCNRGREHKKTNIDEIKSISKSWSRKASQKVIWIQTFWGKTRLFCNIYMRWYQYLIIILSSKFLVEIKSQISHLYIKRCLNSWKNIVDLLVSFQIFLRFTKDAYMIKCQVISKIFFQNINAVFVRVTVHNIAY